MKTTSIMDRQDRRQLRARSVAAAIVQAIDKLLQRDRDLDLLAKETQLLRAIDEAVTNLLTEKGIEVMTDYHRSEIGLPPRDQKGWTVEEILAYERMMLERMTQPMAPMILSCILTNIPPDERNEVRKALDYIVTHFPGAYREGLLRAFLGRLGEG
jgi:hypothetical protein